jgi:hypothetical protein
MDECRFDNLTRMFGAIRDRRTAVKTLVAAGAALVSLAKAEFGIAAQDDVLIEGCRLTGERCDRDKQCCSDDCNRKRKKRKRNRDRDGDGRRRRRDRRGSGECRRRGNGKACRKDAACCRGRCDPIERRCRCVPANDICNKDDDCCDRRRCVEDGNTGQKFCKT